MVQLLGLGMTSRKGFPVGNVIAFGNNYRGRDYVVCLLKLLGNPTRPELRPAQKWVILKMAIINH